MGQLCGNVGEHGVASVLWAHFNSLHSSIDAESILIGIDVNDGGVVSFVCLFDMGIYFLFLRHQSYTRHPARIG